MKFEINEIKMTIPITKNQVLFRHLAVTRKPLYHFLRSFISTSHLLCKQISFPILSMGID